MSDTIEQVKSICEARLKELHLCDMSAYTIKLEQEINDLIHWESTGKTNKAAWLLTKTKSTTEQQASNKSGSLVLFLLGISSVDPIDKDIPTKKVSLSKGDCPDIDTDFDPRVRDWVKERIVETFSEEKTCSIGTYQTYKTRAVIIDVARALGYDVREAMEVTKTIDALARFEVDLGEGETEEQRVDEMSFDEVCRHYAELDAYFKMYPDVRQHAEVLRNQVKNTGKHAGGVIISNLNLQGRIPVFRDKSGQIVSAWSEGLATHELTEVGLVKFDILGLNNLCVISDCVRLVKEHQGVDLSREGIPIDDHDAIKFGSKEDLVGIFQFENPGTKPIVKSIGMESIFDISAVTSLIRPGPKDMGMHELYARRKAGEPFEVLPCLQDVFEDTYGIVVYQEQIQQVATQLAGFDPIASNRLRKALIKEKNPEVLERLKQKFIEGAQPRVEAGELTQEDVVKVFDHLHSFAKYGFNKCLSLDTVVNTPTGPCLLGDVVVGDSVADDTGKFVNVVDVFESEQEVYEFTFESGKQLIASMRHKVLCQDGQMRTLADVVLQDIGVMCDSEK
jgi:DNA polymerase-3 subunit alpha